MVIRSMYFPTQWITKGLNLIGMPFDKAKPGQSLSKIPNY